MLRWECELVDSTFSFNNFQRPQKASNSQEWLDEHTGVSWGSPSQCVWSMRRVIELMPLDYTPPSLRTRVEMGGHLFRDSMNCLEPCLIGQRRFVASFVSVRLFHIAWGANACKRKLFHFVLLLFGDVLGLLH